MSGWQSPGIPLPDMPLTPLLSHRLAVVLAALLASLASITARAGDDDNRFLMKHSRLAAQYHAIAQPTSVTAPPGTVLHEGRIHEVGTHPGDLESAIYMSLNSGQWEKVAEFTSRYRLLRKHRHALVDMADALHARHRGDYRTALRKMQAAHNAEPKDVRIQLELARLLFEDNQASSAHDFFMLARSGGLPHHASDMARQYLAMLDARAGWHGAAAISLGHNSNINQANGRRNCLTTHRDICLLERRMPKPVSAGMASYEISLERRFNLRGNHNLLVQPMGYGSRYRQGNTPGNNANARYSSHISLMYLGYQYLDARTDIRVLPYLEHHYQDGRTSHLAGGLQIDWRHDLSSRWRMGSQLDAKRYHYSKPAQLFADDNTQYQGGVFAAYIPTRSMSIHAGLDITRRIFAVSQASNKEVALHAGVFHALPGRPGIYLNAHGIRRRSRNDAFDGFLGARRTDSQQVYIAAIGVQAWQLAGMTPELRIRHVVNRSNPTWAFSYRQTEVILQLRKRI